MTTSSRYAPTVVDLFSGCGSFSLGLQQAGLRPAVAVELDAHAAATYRANLPGVQVLQRDIRLVTRDDVLAALDNVAPFAVISGSPCQGFSTAGKRDPDDPRNSLLVTAAQLAVSLRPQVFIAENVVGVVSGTHRRHWDEMQSVLRSHDYHTMELRCDAVEHGVPQIRRRMVLIAWRGRHELNADMPTRPIRTLRHAISGINGAMNHQPRSLPADSAAAAIARAIAPGQKLCNVRGGLRSVPTWDVPEVFGRTNSSEREVLGAIRSLRRSQRRRDFGDADPVARTAVDKLVGRPIADILATLLRKKYVRKIGRFYDLTHTYNGKYRRLSWDRPSLTVDTRFGEPRFFLHPSEHRGFTVREAARVQSFPDTFVLSGPLREQYRQIGNAVPTLIAKDLGKLVRTCLE